MLKNRLKDPSLLVELAYIDGQWVGADSAATLDVINPATGEYSLGYRRYMPAKPGAPSRPPTVPGRPGGRARRWSERRCSTGGIRRCSITSTTWR